MKQKEPVNKELGRRITEALSLLPQEKREYMMGYAEGVITMSGQKKNGSQLDKLAG